MGKNDVDININTKADTSGAKAAERSFEDLEKELQDLQAELARVPIGSKQFDTLAGRIKTTAAEMDKTEAAAKKLGGTMGRRGNAGMAALEFSRAFEDAQYGMRGVLNNIPSLVMQLGGTAGLAGVLSIAAVTASQLFERLSNSNNAASGLGKVAERAQNLRDAMEAAAKAERDFFRQRGDDVEERLESISKGAARNLERQSKALSLENARIEAQKRVELAEQSYKLALLEMGILVDGQKEGVSLAQERLEIEQEMEQIALRAKERQRRNEEQKLERSVQAAERPIADAVAERNRRGSRLQALSDELQPLEAEELARAKLLADAADELTEARRANAAELTGTTQGLDGVKEAQRKYKRLLEDFTSFQNDETRGGKKQKLAEAIPAAEDEYREASASVVEFKNALKDAKAELDDLRQKNAFQREASDLESRTQAEVKETKVQRGQTIVTLEDLIREAEAKGGGSPELQGAIQQIEGALKDGNLTAEELGSLELVLSQFRGQMLRLGVLPATFEKAVDAVKDLDSRIKDIERQLPSGGGTFEAGSDLPTPAGLQRGQDGPLPAGLAKPDGSRLPGGMKRGDQSGLSDLKQPVEQSAQNTESISQIGDGLRQVAQNLGKLPGILDVVRDLERRTDDLGRDVEGLKLNSN